MDIQKLDPVAPVTKQNIEALEQINYFLL